MTSDDGFRASDGDRENVVAILREAYVAGRLSLAEFDERTSAAFASRTWGELRALTSDLPTKPSLSVPAPVPARQDGPPEGLPDGELPADQAAQDLRRPGGGRLLPALPIVLVWLLIAASARGAGAYVPLLILLIIGLNLAGGRPYHGRSTQPRGQCRHPGQPPGRRLDP